MAVELALGHIAGAPRADLVDEGRQTLGIAERAAPAVPFVAALDRQMQRCRPLGTREFLAHGLRHFAALVGRHGSRQWGVQPDLLCSARAITNGYFPFGTVMVSEAVAEPFEADRSGKVTILRVNRTAYENGAMIRVSGNNILSPPLVVTENHVGRILSALDAGLMATAA